MLTRLSPQCGGLSSTLLQPVDIYILPFEARLFQKQHIAGSLMVMHQDE